MTSPGAFPPPSDHAPNGSVAARPVPRSADRPLVSVIVPVYNDAARLVGCLEALAAQTYPADRLGVIIVDNGSEDDIVEVVARFEGVRLVHEPRPGSYAARNLGIRESAGAIVAFTDADCVPSPTWVERGTDHLEAGVGLVGGHIEVFPLDPSRPTGAEVYDMMTSFHQQRYIEEVHFSVTANLFTYRSVLDQVGTFDETLKSSGDKEWGRRVHDVGFRLVYAGDVVVRHPARRSLKEIYTRLARLHAGDRDLYFAGDKLIRLAGRKLLHNLRPPLGTVWRALSDHRVPSIGAWARYLAVLATARLLNICLIVRYALGGTSPR